MNAAVFHLRAVDRARELCKLRGIEPASCDITLWRQAVSEAYTELLGASGADTARTPL